MTPTYLTVREYADRLRVNRVTVYRRIKAGEIEAERVGRSIRIPVAATARPATEGPRT